MSLAPKRSAAGVATAGDASMSGQPWARCMPGWQQCATGPARVVGVIGGEGIGPEVVTAALLVLESVTRASGVALDVREIDCLASEERKGLTRGTAEACESILAGGGALFCGAIGGRFVYDLRSRFELFCKLVPLRPTAAIADAAILRPERLRHVDVLLVRENVSGVYFGEHGRSDGGRTAYQNFSYTVEQVERIVDVAARLALRRRGRLSAVVKSGGIPSVSALWREVCESAAFGIAIEVLEVDNAGFQLIADPQRFDVVVAPNLFGDVLADAATVLLASRGMSYSANFGPERRAAYQTGHGAAYDIAGRGLANPVAQILALAMMLRESCALPREADWVEAAVDRVLASGVRTADISGTALRIVGTRELAQVIAAEVSILAAEESGGG